MEGRGWNDTPQIVNQNPTGKLKISLNKRVAFPLQKGPAETTAASESLSTGSLPPPLPPVQLPPAIPLPTPCAPTLVESDTSFNPNDEIERILRIFHECLPTISQPTVQSNVKAKLKNLADDWSACDTELQKLLSELALFVEQKDAKGAGGVQRKIIMQGHNRQWMHGIRQIILNLETSEEKKEEEPSAATAGAT